MASKKKRAQEEERKVLLGRPGNNVKIGIVGLPNVGKSSMFNLLSKLNVPAENYPFCTIDPNVANIPVPDQRFKWLCEKYRPSSEVAPVITVKDIAGLVRGAHEGQGLGNSFLAHIREVDAIYHLVRAFENDEVTHVEESVDPVRDLGIITHELILKDLEGVDNALEGLEKQVARGIGGKEKKFEFETLSKVRNLLLEEKPVRFGEWNNAEIELLNRNQFLTAKEVVYLVNLNKRDYLRKANKWLPRIAQTVEALGGGSVIPFSVEFEQEWLDMELANTLEPYKEANPSHKSALPRILKTGYHALQLIHYFTAGSDEVKAWTIKNGRLAPEAAGVIHTDFERGFICAEVMAYDDLRELGDEEAVKKAGKLRQQGKKYVVLDGDIIHFKFNV